MVDRSEAKSSTYKRDSRLQALLNSPYAQQQQQQHSVHFAMNHRRHRNASRDSSFESLLGQKRLRRTQVAMTEEILLRALQIGHRHSRRLGDANVKLPSGRHRSRSQGRRQVREKSAPGQIIRAENNNRGGVRVTSAHHRNRNTDSKASTFDQDQHSVERIKIDRLNTLSADRHGCEVTMFYGPKPSSSTDEAIPDEIVVLQQHSTGENLVVYKGFLVEGESFSFKSQRRTASALSLAFYVKGFIDSIVNDCCEFQYSKRQRRANDRSQFSIDRVRKASPCDKCRRKYGQETRTLNINETASNTVRDENSQKVPQSSLASTPKVAAVDDKQEHSSAEKPQSSPKEPHQSEKTKDHKKHPATVKTIADTEDKGEPITSEQKTKKPSKPTMSADTKKTLTKTTEAKITTAPAQDNPTEETPTETTTMDTETVKQMFMAFLKQLTKKTNEQVDQLRHEKSVENFIYILDGNVPLSDSDKTTLRGLINFGVTFDDINSKECQDFIEQIVHEQIIIILSKATIEKLDPTIHDATQVHCIYVIDKSKDCSKNSPKIRGIFSSMSSLSKQLQNDIQLFTEDLTTILSIAADSTGNNRFAYVQVLKDILLEDDKNTDLEKEMLAFCRQEYADNPVQLQFIDEFEHNFQPDDAVNWYIRPETFLFKMLARSLRVPNPDILFKLRYFVQHLHHQLTSTHSLASKTVYRTQLLSNEMLKEISKTQGGLLAFNQFLLTHKTQSTTAPSSVHTKTRSVLFEIELDTVVPSMDIGTSQENVLITSATVFRIAHVQQNDQEMPTIKLTSSENLSKATKEITKSVFEAASGPLPLLRMAKLMKEMEYMQYTEYFCVLLMDDPVAEKNDVANLTAGGLFHSLCSHYYSSENYDRAFLQLERSLKVYLRCLPPDDIKLTPTYNNMGSIYLKREDLDKALELHRKAYEIQKNSPNPDLDSVAAYAGNIASVLMKQKKYVDAIYYLNIDLKIQVQLHPNGDNAHVAVKYHNLAGAQFRAEKYEEALENYKRCLEIELKTHEATAATVGVTYFNMATALAKLGQLKEGIEAVQKAIERLLMTKDEDDEEVQMYRAYEKRLEQKLWVKIPSARMYSVRLGRRKPIVDSKDVTSEQTGGIDLDGPVTSRRYKRQQDDLPDAQNVPESLSALQKPTKQNDRLRVQSGYSNKVQDPSAPTRLVRPTTSSTRMLREQKNDSEDRYPSSSFPTQLTTNHSMLQKQKSSRDYHPIFTIPHTLLMSTKSEKRQYSCHITMTYRSDTILSTFPRDAKRDEITILQETNNSYISIVFKGFLRVGDKFAFKSQRSMNDSFQLILCINDLVDSHISACCEYQYRHGTRVGERDGSFWIQRIDGSKPCHKCPEDSHAKSGASSIDGRKTPPSSHASSAVSSTKLPKMTGVQATHEIKPKTVAMTKSTTSEDTDEDIDADEVQDSESSADESHPTTAIAQLPILVPTKMPSSTALEETKEKSKSKEPSSQDASTKQPEHSVVPSKAAPPPVVIPEKKADKAKEPPSSSSEVKTSQTDDQLLQELTEWMEKTKPHAEHREPLPARTLGDVETFSIVWMGKLEQNDIALLHHAVNFITIVDSIDTLNTFLNQTDRNKVLVFLPHHKAQSIIEQIHDKSSVHSIYLLSSEEEKKASHWMKDYYKIAGIYQSIDIIRDHLFQTLPRLSLVMVPIVVTADDSTTDQAFTYLQLLKETMLCTDDEGDLKKDMLEFSRLHYENNQDELLNIDEFEKTFVPDHVIQWYTRNTFVRKVLDRALQTQEMELLFKMRFLMQCLHKQLKSSAIDETISVHAVLEMSVDNATKLRKNINGLLLFGAFLPAMIKPPPPDSNEGSEQISIVFSISLGAGCGARIQHLCSADMAIDVLINIDTIFRIRSVKKESSKHWSVSLVTVSNSDPQFKQLTNTLRGKITAPVVILQLTRLLLSSDRYAECDHLADLIFKDGSLRDDHTLLASLAAVHHMLGNADDEKDDAISASKQFVKSLYAFKKFLPVNHSMMSPSYNNIGSMCFKADNYDLAIKFHEKALDCQLKSSSPDTDAVATYSNNIGAVYFEQKKYAEAAKHLTRAAKILESLLPAKKGLSLGGIYQKIASSYWRMDKAKEALEYYKKTLALQLATTSPDTHSLSVTYFNLSTAYARIGAMDDAEDSAKKSIEQLLKIYPPDHEEVKENQAQLELVRQKKWLQEVLAD